MDKGQEQQGETFEAVYKSFVERGPNKRKIKPVESQLVQFAFGELDSEEDEDYQVPDDDISDNSNANDDMSDEQADSEGEDEGKGDGHSPIPTNGTTVDEMLCVQSNDDFEMSLANESAPKTSGGVLHCGICLEWESTEEDEILQCDNCGVSVHEGCYGKCRENDDVPPKSDDESDSTSSTVPWFCDACKATVSCPPCELCPCRGGIYKQCDTGRWAHLVCALYTPGIRFGNEDTLDPVIIDEIPSSHWGARDCTLCEDDRFCRTGVTIGCDAGLCRTHFHVTCAQREGLLSEVPDANISSDDVADPLFAHCKLHSDKSMQKARRRSWLSYDASARLFCPDWDDTEKQRIVSALASARTVYQEHRLHLSPSKHSSTKSPRLLTSCPEACQRLVQKSELLGYTVQQASAPRSRKQGRSQTPNLSVEFVKHFYEREIKLKQLNQLSAGHGKESVLLLQQREKTVREELATLKKKYENETEISTFLQADIDKLLCGVEAITGNKIVADFSWKSSVEQDKTVAGESTNDVEKLVKNVIRQCFGCHSQEDHHKMVECDTCHHFYHFMCVEPPLKRMPKKSARFLWQCTDCDESSESEEEVIAMEQNNSGTPKRSHRATIKPEKFTPDLAATIKRKTLPGMKRGRKRRSSSEPGVPGRKKKVIISNDVDKDSTPKPKYCRGRKKAPLVYDTCFVCQKKEEMKEMAKCAECHHCFHFKTCLDPPYKTTPQKRGYSWYCTDCDSTQSDASDDRSPTKDTNGDSVNNEDADALEVSNSKDINEDDATNDKE